MNVASPAESHTIPTALNTASRIQSLDVLRGVIMVLMAIDHVRVYSGVPPGGPDAGVFFTRWITHYCAPGFAFFAGTSAFLYGRKLNDTRKLASYLLTRGLLLIALELTVIRLFWTFNLALHEFILAGVIWMLGWCMIFLAMMVALRPKVIAAIGLGIVALQQLFAFLPGLIPDGSRASFGRIWEFVYPSGFETFNGISVLYSLVPWVGVMAAGYGFGAVLAMSPGRRNKICLWIGAIAIALFAIGATIQALNNTGENAPPFIFRLLNQAKYPASQLFLLMTLGPLILLVPFAERTSGWLSKVLMIFGRVPFFYYLAHILLIHVSALAVHLMLEGRMHHEWYTYAPYAQVPPESRWSLGLLYLVFVVDVSLLFFICRWYAKYKQEHPEKKWLAFL